MIEMRPFEKSCVGVAAKTKYDSTFTTRKLDLWRVAYVGLATLLFFNAQRICSSVFLYYSAGIGIGVVGFLIVLVYLLSRYMPKKPIALSVIVGGWSLSLYLMQWLWENLMDIVLEYRLYLYTYVLVSSVISFGFLYRFEPLTHSRSKDLLRWGLQAAAMLLIVWSSYFVEATMAYNIVLLLLYNFPSKWTRTIKLYWLKRYPPKRRLLTEEEFIQEGDEQTRRSLDDLREYCRSPHCDSWKIVSRLKSPQRFAEFVGGSPHLTDTEVLDHTLWEDPYLDNYSDDGTRDDDLTDESDDDDMLSNGT